MCDLKAASSTLAVGYKLFSLTFIDRLHAWRCESTLILRQRRLGGYRLFETPSDAVLTRPGTTFEDVTINSSNPVCGAVFLHVLALVLNIQHGL